MQSLFLKATYFLFVLKDKCFTHIYIYNFNEYISEIYQKKSQFIICCLIHLFIVILFFVDGIKMSQSPFPHCVIESFVESTDKGNLKNLYLIFLY